MAFELTKFSSKFARFEFPVPKFTFLRVPGIENFRIQRELLSKDRLSSERPNAIQCLPETIVVRSALEKCVSIYYDNSAIKDKITVKPIILVSSAVKVITKPSIFILIDTICWLYIILSIKNGTVILFTAV